MYTTSKVQHVRHIHNSSTTHRKTTLSLPNKLATDVFPPSMLVQHVADQTAFIPLMYPSTYVVHNIKMYIV